MGLCILEDDNLEQDKVTQTLLARLNMLERGQEEEKLYLHRNKTINGKKKGSTFKQKQRHEWHVGIFNGLLNTAKNAQIAGFEIPKELSYFLLDYMWSQANGGGEWQIVTDIRKINLEKMSIIESAKYTRAVCFFIDGHKDGNEEILNNPGATVKKNINDTQYKHEKYDFSDKYCGYKVAHERRKLNMKDFEIHLSDVFPLGKRMVRNKIKTYKLDVFINKYLKESQLVKI